MIHRRSRHLLALLAIVLVALVAAAIGGGLLKLGVMSSEAVKEAMDKASPDGVARTFPLERVAKIVERSRLWGIVLIASSGTMLLVFIVVRRLLGRALATAIDALRRAPYRVVRWLREEPAHAALLAAFLLIGAAIRVSFLWMEIRGDEAVTIMTFASRPLAYALSDYPSPNNHVFYTFLCHVALRVFGYPTGSSGEIWAARLPALIVGVLTIPALYAGARSIFDRRVALLASAIAMGMPYLVYYSANARGYGIIALATVLLISLATRGVRSNASRAWLCIPIVGTIGFHAVPTMLFPFLGVCLWIGLESLVATRGPGRWSRLGRLMISGLATVWLTLLAYIPVLVVSGPRALVANRFITPMTTPEFWHEMALRGGDFLRHLHAGVPLPIVAIIALGLGASFVAHFWIARHRVPWIIMLALGAGIILLVQRAAPYPGVWIFVVPVYIMLAASGLVWLGDMIFRDVDARDSTSMVLSAALGSGLLAFLVIRRGPEGIREGDLFGHAEVVAEYLTQNAHPDDRLLMAWPTLPVLEYHAPRVGLSNDLISRDTPDGSHTLVLITTPPELLRMVAPSRVDEAALDDFNKKLEFLHKSTLSLDQLVLIHDFENARLYRIRRTIGDGPTSPDSEHGSERSEESGSSATPLP
ncbi:MAG: glycosyltransferase family 39 protein [Phycisphaerales bacterium]|nr:MAG: glycosyltransferase family 39 protein [Phycisphaerales bacterium]